MYVCVYISYDIVLYLFKLYIFIYCLYFIYILHHLIFMLSILIVGPSIFFYNFSSLIFFSSAEERNLGYLGYFQILVFFFFFLKEFLFYFFIIYLFIYFWLWWVFVSVRGLSLVVASGGHSSSRCAGLSLSRPLLLRSTGSRRAGSVVVAHGPSCSAACGIFPDQGSNPCALHWQADSQPLRHQGSPNF